MCQYSNQKELAPLSPYRCLFDLKLPPPRSTPSQPVRRARPGLSPAWDSQMF
jgi:hypothetical protein